MTRRAIENPRDVPCFKFAIAAIDALGCTIRGGYTLGNTVAGLQLADKEGRPFSVEVTPHDYPKGGELVRKAVEKLAL